MGIEHLSFVPPASVGRRPADARRVTRPAGRRLVVYLAHLHTTFGKYLRVTVPLGMTYVHAYLRARFGDEMRIRAFATPVQVDAAPRDETPGVFAFGNYSWNTSVTRAVIRTVKLR